MCEVRNAVGKFYNEKDPKDGLEQFTHDLQAAFKAGANEKVFEILQSVSDSVVEVLKSLEKNWLTEWAKLELNKIPEDVQKLLEDFIPRKVKGKYTGIPRLKKIVADLAIENIPSEKENLKVMKQSLIWERPYSEAA